MKMRMLSDSEEETVSDTSVVSPKSSSDEELDLQRKVAQKLAMLRRPEYDPPCQVAPGLFIGGVGAARDLEKLQALGVTHVVNASPIVPCFHKKVLRYKSVNVFDDSDEDIAQFFPTISNYISRGIRKGGILVHCYAGQSRSSALIMAYLIQVEGFSVAAALELVQAARPCALPNEGFLRQLREYAVATKQ